MTQPASSQPPQIELRLEGPAVPGRIRVDVLTSVAKELQTTLRRMLASPRRDGGRFPTGIEQACVLEFTQFTPGSAVLTFEFAGPRDRDTLHGDPGLRVANEMLDAMQKAEAGDLGWQAGLQAGVAEGWETLARPLGEGVDSMRITLREGPRARSVDLTVAFRSNLRRAAAGHAHVVDGEIEGVLWECDWQQHTAQLHEADGNRVLLALAEGLEERVTELRRQRVRVVGRIERQGGRAVRATITAVAPVRSRVGEPDPRFGGFWDKLSVDELSARQGVGPVADLDALAGDWPDGDSVDDFLNMVREVRGG